MAARSALKATRDRAPLSQSPCRLMPKKPPVSKTNLHTERDELMTYKIMIVDDEPANLRTLLRLFRQDYEVVVAESGPEALQLLQQHNVALLISDQRMPDM